MLKPGSQFNDMHRHRHRCTWSLWCDDGSLSSLSLHAAWGTGSEEVVDCLISLSLMGMGMKRVVLIDGCPLPQPSRATMRQLDYDDGFAVHPRALYLESQCSIERLGASAIRRDSDESSASFPSMTSGRWGFPFGSTTNFHTSTHTHTHTPLPCRVQSVTTSGCPVRVPVGITLVNGEQHRCVARDSRHRNKGLDG